MLDILVEILIYLAAAVIAVPISQRLGFGSVLGYLAAGAIIGPVLGLVGSEAEDLRHYAEFGVVLMLFLIGLELEPKVLWRMRRQLFGLGGLQVALTLGLITMVCLMLGIPGNQALVLGIILCLSSTAIVMQTLNEKRLVGTPGGRSSFAVLLFQDMAALPFLAVIPLLALGQVVEPATVNPHEGGASEAAKAISALAGWMQASLIIGAVGLVVLAGRYLVGPFFDFLNQTRLHEINIAAAIMIIVAIAALMELLGLSPALGTFLAGMMLANSEYKHELESDIGPLKGLLLGLFFITVGASMNLSLVASQPAKVLGFVLALMILKLVVLYVLARTAGLQGKDRVLFTLCLAQAGEFGFFLTSFAQQNRILPEYRADMVLVVITLSMFLTPALFLIHDLLTRRIKAGPRRPDDEIDEQGTVIIAGMGRFGQIVNRMLKGLGHKTVVLDSRPETIEQMRRFGIKGFYGEVDRPALLEAAGIAHARAIVVAPDDPAAVLRISRYVSKRHPHVHIIARAYDRHHVYALYAAGAKDSVREVFDSGVRAGKYALSALGYSDDEVSRVSAAFFEHDRKMLVELAELWDPAVPLHRNEAYIEKARAQHGRIQSVLRGELDEERASQEKKRKKKENKEREDAEAGGDEPETKEAGKPVETAAE